MITLQKMIIVSLSTTLLILDKDKSSVINYVLNNKIIVYLGKMSYSMYLWHLPIFIILSYYLSDNFFYLPLTIILILGFSYFSYFFIECPIRFSKKYDKFLQIVILPSLVILFFYLIFNYSNLKKNISKIYNSNFNFFSTILKDVRTLNKPFDYNFKNCQLDKNSLLKNTIKDIKNIQYDELKNQFISSKTNNCFNRNNNRELIFLIGDSIATSIANVLNNEKYDTLIISKGGFLFSNNMSAITDKDYSNKNFYHLDLDSLYRDLIIKVFNKISLDYRKSHILISSRYDDYLRQDTVNNYRILDQNKEIIDNINDLENDISKILNRFENNPNFFFIENMPIFKDDIYQCVKKLSVNKNYNCNLSKEEFLKINYPSNKVLNNLVSKHQDSVKTLTFNDLICSDETCNFFFKEGQSWIVDTMHANPITFSSDELRSIFNKKIENLIKK